MSIDGRVGCSSISFRKLPLAAALDTIAGLGFGEIDLGALPGVCEHVPADLDDAGVAEVARLVGAAGLRVRTVNGDIGDLNVPGDTGTAAARRAHLGRLVELCAAVGAAALVLPCGAQGHEPVAGLADDLDLVAAELATASSVAAGQGVRIWVETLHSGRLCRDLARAAMLTERLRGTGTGVVMDLSHVVASGGDPLDFVAAFAGLIRHVHIRDAAPGDIHLTPGNGDVDFVAALAALRDAGYTGHFALELETADVSDDDRPAAALRVGQYISSLLR